jgi:hypothetical protein
MTCSPKELAPSHWITRWDEEEKRQGVDDPVDNEDHKQPTTLKPKRVDKTFHFW